jgi:hypothetical protein
MAQRHEGKLSAHFAVVRVRVADDKLMSHGQPLPGRAAWLVCEARSAINKMPAVSGCEMSSSTVRGLV